MGIVPIKTATCVTQVALNIHTHTLKRTNRKTYTHSHKQKLAISLFRYKIKCCVCNTVANRRRNSESVPINARESRVYITNKIVKVKFVPTSKNKKKYIKICTNLNQKLCEKLEIPFFKITAFYFFTTKNS